MKKAQEGPNLNRVPSLAKVSGEVMLNEGMVVEDVLTRRVNYIDI